MNDVDIHNTKSSPTLTSSGGGGKWNGGGISSGTGKDRNKGAGNGQPHDASSTKACTTFSKITDRSVTFGGVRGPL